MEFFLVKDEEVIFNQNRRPVLDAFRSNLIELVARDTGSSSIPVDIIPSAKKLAVCDENGLFYRNFCKDLKTILDSERGSSPAAANKKDGPSGPSGPKQQKMMVTTSADQQGLPPVNWGLRADLCLMTYNSPGWSIRREWIRVSGHFLEILKSVLERHGYAVKLSMKVSSLRFKGSNGRAVPKSIQTLATREVDIAKLSSPGRKRADNTINEKNAGAAIFSYGNCWKEYWGKEGNDSIGYCDLTIKAIVYSNQWRSLSTTGKDTTLQRILKQEICADVVIETGDEVEVNCHRSVLSAQSPVLEAMFRNDFGFQESKTGRVDMTDMSESGVKAFIDYLYGECLKAPTENPAIALEVLQAAHKYQVTKLEQIILELFKSKSDKWLGVDEALQLFSFVRNIPEESSQSLKTIALNIIKSNYAVLEGSPTYRGLFRKNPDVAKELFEHVIKSELESRSQEKRQKKKDLSIWQRYMLKFNAI